MKKKAIYLVLLMLTIIVSVTVYADNNLLEIHFLDVGQADAIFIKLPNGQHMVIDGGNNADGAMVVEYLKKEGVEKIDYLIGTHPHEDHIGGLDDLIRSFSIGKIYLPEVIHTSKTFEDVLRAVKDKGMKITAARKGMTILAADELEAKILSPLRDDYKNLNNWSVVVKLCYGSTSYLFTGDAEKEVEEEMLKGGLDLTADLLKVGHHGSSTSTSEPFLTAVAPKFAVISVGEDNNYNHPSSSTLQKLFTRKIKVFRTDQQGTIVARSDGKKIEIDKESLQGTTDFVAKDSNITMRVDLKEEIVKLTNNSSQVLDLSKWLLVSTKGEQKFYFPEGTLLEPGKELLVLSGRNAKSGLNTIVWTKGYIWNNQGDPALLYDAEGNLVAGYPEEGN